MDRGDDIAKVGRTLIGMDEAHRECKSVRFYTGFDKEPERKPMEAGNSRGNVVTST